MLDVDIPNHMKQVVLRFSNTRLKDMAYFLRLDDFLESVWLPRTVEFAIDGHTVNYSLYSLFNYLQWSEFDGETDVWPEGFVSQRFAELIEAGDVVYDIGADHGYYSLLSEINAAPDGVVYAFEPHPRNARAAETNLAQNDISCRTSVNQAIVADTTGKTAVADNSPREIESTDENGYETSSVTVDQFAQQHAPPDVVKIDVQGGEAKAIRGMKKTLNEHSPDIVVEMHDEEEVRRLDGSWDQIYSALLEQGCAITRVWDPYDDEDSESNVDSVPDRSGQHHLIAKAG
jgi:FkbM family methyltransferase